MNEFLDQFLIESRELVEQATTDLLWLEAHPRDEHRLNEFLRALHTLKGAAGIVEFAAMAQTLHAAEDALSGVRSGQKALTQVLVTESLNCLDQISVWLDGIQADGEIPADAAAAAEATMALFRQTPVEAGATETLANWIEPLLAKFPSLAPASRVAIRYTPAIDCFFHGEDPLNAFSRLPGLLAMDLILREALPSLTDLAPYDCVFSIAALSLASTETLEQWVQAFGDSAEIVPLRAASSAPLPLLQQILQAQIELLEVEREASAPGIVPSIVRTAVNVLRHDGRMDEAGLIEKAAGETELGRQRTELLAALKHILRIEPRKEDHPSWAAGEVPVGTATRGVRVEFGRIDKLVKLISELIVVKNDIGYSADLARRTPERVLASKLKDQHAILDRLADQLQRSILDIRVFPLRQVFQRFPRLVREMATSLGKSARLVIEGEATEADKTIVEGLFEPLLHVLRNAIDHGVEQPEVRVAAGKQPTAIIFLRASRTSNQVIIEVEDDGNGIDADIVKQAAIQRRVVSPLAAASMTHEAIIDLIFEPGFSTTVETTALSGRGMGMEAVRTSIERLNGRVGVESAVGQGTIVRFSLPFTIMLTRIITVETAGQVFGIPVDAVVETITIPRQRISPIGRERAFIHRHRTIPLIRTTDIFGEVKKAHAEGDVNVVILRVDSEWAAMQVESFGTTMDVMLNPLEGVMAGMAGISGTSLLGDGRVLIVLDPQELVR
jgi:two-component system chemotaxis sensor kinase CheA